MPELPEVEAARSAIADNCIGKTIVKVIIANDSKVINGVTPSEFEASILNKTIINAYRKGKNMWLQLDSPPFPSFQFGMAGAIYIKGVAVTKYKRSAVNDADEWPSKFSKFFIQLNDGLELSFTDKRRFATVRLLDDPTSVPPISELGPDALLEPMTEEEFYNSLSKKNIAIKTLLLDQSFISGIGNWVADEVLYQARIHPSQGASSLPRDDSSRLLKSIKEVIQKAVEVGADSNRYPTNWIFHSREKKHGKAIVDGKKIDFITVGGRTTAYVPELQKLSGQLATKATGRSRKQASKKKDDDDSVDGNNDEDNDGDAGESNNSKSAGKKPPKRKTRGSEVPTKTESQEKGGNGDANKSKKTHGERKISSKANNDSDASDDDGDQKKSSKAKGQKPQVKRKKAK